MTFTPSPDSPTPESIHAQRKKLLETRKLNRSLQEEANRNTAVISQLKNILSTVETAKQESGKQESNPPLDLSFLTSGTAARQLRIGVDAGANSQHTPLTTHTHFILSQLPALQTTLANLRPKLASLSTPVNESDTKSKRDERKEYIESRIRLHLERAGQLAIGDDGNSVVAGRRIDISEAQALENVANMLTQQKKST